MRIEWKKYREEKPNKGDLVIVYRDIESLQTYVTKWSETDELYADWNKVTHWTNFNYPPQEGI